MSEVKMRVLLSSVLMLVILTRWVGGCELEPPPEQRGAGKSPGDNHYKILISGDPERYVPGELYTVTLVGSRTHDRLQQFTHFQLVARPLKPETPVSPQHQGQFQLFADTLTTFSERCINTVLEADDLPKTEVQVMWKAPARGSGCVNIQAMVQEDERRWFAEDGQLTRRVCEQTTRPQSPESCCACDEAKYSLVFEGLWRKETHPKDFPTSLWLMHFSDLIGASHEPNFTFWGEGEIATDGFRSLAEWGSTGLLEQELKQRGGHLRTLVKAAGLWHPRVNANTSGTFVVDRRRPKLSLASMLGPSPDWVVGVNGLNLCREDCSWIERKTIDLYPYDAGTDNGISYMSPNAETVPREKMYRITTMYPEDPRAPFYQPGRAEMAPLARLYLTREKIIPKGCDEVLLQKLVVDVAENTEDTSRPECETGAWSAWSPCSVPCGKGLRMRTRAYLVSDAGARGCDRQLVGKEMCVAAVPECPEESGGERDVEDTSGMCATSAWGEWSACSETCGVGVRMRVRTFLQPGARKKCTLIGLVEKEKCMEPECDPAEVERPDAACPTTPWSDWSPCSASCGRGLELRTRLLLVEPARQVECAARLNLLQQRPCLLKENCNFDMVTAKQVCMQPAEVGPCRGTYPRWAFNAQKLMCVPFYYGGCKGNQNNFLAQSECTSACQVVIDLAQGNQAVNQVSSPTEPRRLLAGVTVQQENVPQLPATSDRVDCQHGPWSDWSPCSVSCGRGFQEKTKPIIVEAQNGGVPCPSRLARRKRCYQRCF